MIAKEDFMKKLVKSDFTMTYEQYNVFTEKIRDKVHPPSKNEPNKPEDAIKTYLRQKKDEHQSTSNQEAILISNKVPEVTKDAVVAETDQSKKKDIHQQDHDQELGANKLGFDTILLIICANRPQYLDRTLSHVTKYHPKKSVPILISQDGNHPEVNEVISRYQETFRTASNNLVPFDHIHFSGNNAGYENGYFRLADHFKFALNNAFEKTIIDPTSQESQTIKRVIILEEDLQIAPDFFEFFAATYSFLDNPNNNLLAISAWNDNGFKSLVKDNKQIYRSDFFPGLGWMLTKALWENELKKKWPKAYWDDWLREPKQRQGRHILRPEVCRTLHFGTHGVSNAQYSNYLTSIALNEEYIPFTTMSLNYLLESNWDKEYLSHIANAQILHQLNEFDTIAANAISNPRPIGSPPIEVKIYYGSLDENSYDSDSFRSLAQWSGAMNNVKAGVPRTAYKGIVTVWKANIRVHLVPRNSDF
jgi:alpha-1,3-mannosyl-glycoprotein beta-1,2-N-acetylglucosaminyltransferase